MTDSRQYLRPDVLARIGDLEFRARSVVEGFLSGMHRSPYHGHSVEFAQHREYVPGDDLRRLDWRVYGKSDRFYVKQYEEETNLRVHLLLDCSASMRYPDMKPTDGRPSASGRLTKFEYGATLAACLAHLLVRQQDAPGLVLFDDEVRGEVPTASSFAHVRALIARLEQARQERPTRTAGLFTRLSERLAPRSAVVVISDLLADADELIDGLRRMRYARHEVVVMHVLDRDEREFPFHDHTLFEGLERPELQLLTDPQSLRRAYLDALSAHLDRIRTACGNDRMDYVELTTTDPLDVALRAYLAARMHFLKARA